MFHESVASTLKINNIVDGGYINVSTYRSMNNSSVIVNKRLTSEIDNHHGRTSTLIKPPFSTPAPGCPVFWASFPAL